MDTREVRVVLTQEMLGFSRHLNLVVPNVDLYLVPVGTTELLARGGTVPTILEIARRGAQHDIRIIWASRICESGVLPTGYPSRVCPIKPCKGHEGKANSQLRAPKKGVNPEPSWVSVRCFGEAPAWLAADKSCQGSGISDAAFRIEKTLL